ncbi:hypothetical protein BJF93_19375 [Xaviernesmea oryzae]|uniref:Uncharacterized protein n=1 Tax=Xaviernesmea oryzae TaxID=464029 RepID=A0A1Q9B1H0_9HYPH|nr:DUF6107 family protein [Xaviernesmea oryzae]OLP61848.1 hypothetical protein BJF93_19375 [Xaviernesmea oryzae]SEL75510.1 hypothetical protein SAMN04487976_11265 [Xaviernesmea oryzae]
MSDWNGVSDMWLARTLGAFAGACVSLVYMLPKSAQEAATRFLSGVTCGLVFGGPAGVWLAEKLEIATALSPSEILLAGSSAASLGAWWGLGAAARIAGRLGRETVSARGVIVLTPGERDETAG